MPEPAGGGPVPAGSATVRGSVLFPQAFAGDGAVLHVYVEDVGRADAPARIAARLDLPLPGGIGRGQSLPFSLEVAGVDPACHYAVRVHVDRSANGRVEVGDCVSTQSHPVLTRGAPASVEVPVLPVSGP